MNFDQVLTLIPEDSWFRAWMKCWPHSEPPKSYILLSGMMAMGACFGRRVKFDHDVHVLYPMLNLLLIGPSGIGKTTALDAYATAHNHGETMMVRMPTRGGLGDLLSEFAFRLSISRKEKYCDLRRRVLDSFDKKNLIIIDECHQCLTSDYSSRALASLEFLREIWDRRKCGMVLCGTNTFRDSLKSNLILRQLWLRGYRPLQLPKIPSQANLAEFARHYGLVPASDREIEVQTDDEDTGKKRAIRGNPLKLEEKTVTTFGLGRWLSILDDASEAAREAGVRISWGRVIAAAEAFEQSI